ncbi:glycosyltransferase [Streptacidiphilus carbonis]|uniref:glycosyltransferase n=1 Tax=Streptacidiphilus carbonis TaxID=105422 RepID=UPI0005AA83FF|nr:nucleotide disphospho-sugar-binding domain-containing protein [Streptacidiphilus carbonis]
MAKIIVAAPPVPGEVLPLLQLAGALAARGHDITVLTGTAFRSRVVDAGLRFAPLAGKADYDIGLFAGSSERTALAAGPDQLNFDWIHLFANPMPDEHRALQDLLEQDPDQYLICNLLFLGALPVKLGAAGRSPLRWIAVSVVGIALSSDDSTFFGPAPVGPGEDQTAANRAANAQFGAAFQPTQDRLNHLLSAMGATEEFLNFSDRLYTTPDQTAILSVPGFEFARRDLPANVHLVGVLPAESDDEWQPPDWWPELDGARPVVVVTQGTLANHDLSHLVEPTLAGLADMDVTVVAALGRDPGAISVPLPANSRVAGFIPFRALLPKADLLITNGGASGTQHALAAGVPAVVAGATEDKPAVAARIAYHGLGINLGTATPTAQAVAEATEVLLADEKTRENVARLAKIYAEHDPVAEIEHLALG